MRKEAQRHPGYLWLQQPGKSTSINCTSGFNVAEKIKDVSRLINVPEDFIT
jgi:hypothetical protein